jgi:hypothetical protein
MILGDMNRKNRLLVYLKEQRFVHIPKSQTRFAGPEDF